MNGNSSSSYIYKTFHIQRNYSKIYEFLNFSSKFSKLRDLESIPGEVAHCLVEAPRVKNGKVIGWNTCYAPNREWGIDMAGFAINLHLFLRNNELVGKRLYKNNKFFVKIRYFYF